MTDLTIKEMSLVVGNWLGLDFSDNLFWHLPKKEVLLKWLADSGNNEVAKLCKDSWQTNGYLLYAEWLAVYNTIPEASEEESSSEEQMQEFHGQDADCQFVQSTDYPTTVDFSAMKYEELSNFVFTNMPRFWVDRIQCIRPNINGDSMTIWFKL